MKKALFTAVILALVFVAFSANDSFAAAKGKRSMKVDAGGGYHFSSGGQFLGRNQTGDYKELNGVSYGSSLKDENIFGSLGKGINIFANFSMGLSEFLDAGIGFNYLIGFNNTMERTGKYSSIENRTTYNQYKETGSMTTTVNISGSGFWFTPFISVNAGMKTINPYAKFGIIFALLSAKAKEEINSKYERYYGTNLTSLSTDQYKRTIDLNWTGGFTIGFNGAIGAEFVLSKALAVFLEANLINMNYLPSEREIKLNSESTAISSSGTVSRTTVVGSKTYTLVDEFTQISSIEIDELDPNSAEASGTLRNHKYYLPVTITYQSGSNPPEVTPAWPAINTRGDSGKNEMFGKGEGGGLGDEFTFSSIGIRIGARIALFQY